jgi:HAD superfamily hydrolase (TIGR01509 family)
MLVWMTKPEAAIFDNDGLLLDTEQAWTRAEVRLFAARGRAFTATHKRTLIGSSRSSAAAKLEAMLGADGQGEALMDELHELVMEEALAGVEPRPGALDVLALLGEAGVPLALASNSSREFVERTLSCAQLLHDGPFAAVVCAEDVARPKPAPDIYLEACARLDVEPGNAVALEDSPIGVAAAAAAGLRVIGVPYLADMELPGSHLLADSLAAESVLALLGLAGRAVASAG